MLAAVLGIALLAALFSPGARSRDARPRHRVAPLGRARRAVLFLIAMVASGAVRSLVAGAAVAVRPGPARGRGGPAQPRRCRDADACSAATSTSIGISGICRRLSASPAIRPACGASRLHGPRLVAGAALVVAGAYRIWRIVLVALADRRDRHRRRGLAGCGAGRHVVRARRTAPARDRARRRHCPPCVAASSVAGGGGRGRIRCRRRSRPRARPAAILPG